MAFPYTTTDPDGQRIVNQASLFKNLGKNSQTGIVCKKRVPTALGHWRSNDLVLFSLGGLGESFFVLVFLLFRWPRLDGRPHEKSRSRQASRPRQTVNLLNLALRSGYVDADCPFRMSRDKKRHGILNGRIV